MKKNFFILIVLPIVLLFSISVFAQEKFKLKLKPGSRTFCGVDLKKGFYDKGTYEIHGESYYIVSKGNTGDESGIFDVIEGIKKAIRIDATFDVYVMENEGNAYATIDENMRNVILADHMFLVQTNELSGTKWGAVGILAHEVGHHIAGLGRGKPGELDADYWSGYALQKLGSSKNASSKWIMAIGDETDSKSHPNKYLRKSAIEEGWEDAKKETYDVNRCKSCKN